MPIATRKTITVPAAGEFTPVHVAGRVVYVEQSPIDTPTGVPTWHLQNAGDGLPLYSRSALAWIPSFRRFWIRGTADSAGAELRLLVYDDPCADGIYGENAPLQFNQCPEPEGVTEPTGTPTHVLQVSTGSDEIFVMDAEGNHVRDVITGRLRIGRIHVDYAAGWIFWVEENGTGVLELRRIDFDGTNEVLLYDAGGITSGGSNPVHVSWDPTIGALLLANQNANRTHTINRDGTGILTRDTLGVSHLHLAGLDGTHYFLAQGSALVKRLYSSGASAAVGGVAVAVVADPFTGNVFALTSSGVEVYDSDLSAAEEIAEHDGILDTLTSYGRWLYYSPTANRFDRIHMDDLENIETIATGLSDGLHAYPWWE